MKGLHRLSGTLPLPVPQFSIGLRSLKGVKLLLKMKRGVGDRWGQWLKTNIDAAEKMLREDAQVTYTYTEASLRIGSGSVPKILHIYLRVSKMSSRWVPQFHWRSLEWNCCCEMLRRFTNWNYRRDSEIITGDKTWICQCDPETKRHSSVWGFPNDDRPVKVKRAKNFGRKMVLTFFAAGGHVATIPLENQRTVTAQWYTTVALPQVLQKLREKRPRAGFSGILLHHDNTSAHVTHLTMDFVTPVQLLSHPPYSPDLAPGWLLSVPYGEGPTAWEAVFKTWRRGCSIPRGAMCTGWQWLAPVLQIVVQEDATLHRCSGRVLW